jgi:hypothetical protein
VVRNLYYSGKRGDIREYSFDDDPREALRRAEKYFGTNKESDLLLAMAVVLFPPPGRGRKKGKTWNFDKYLRLGLAYDRVKRDCPKRTDGQIAEIISKEDPDFREYRNNSELLRQRLPEAKRIYDFMVEEGVINPDFPGRLLDL